MATVHGWELFAHPLFLDQLEKLMAAVESSRRKDPRGWRKGANSKLLAALHKLVFETIPGDPTRAEYRQGGTLGSDRKHWFRAKYGGGRFRLFFRYSTGAKVIIFARINDERRCAPMRRRRMPVPCSARCSTRAARLMTGHHS